MRVEPLFWEKNDEQVLCALDNRGACGSLNRFSLLSFAEKEVLTLEATS